MVYFMLLLYLNQDRMAASHKIYDYIIIIYFLSVGSFYF